MTNPSGRQPDVKVRTALSRSRGHGAEGLRCSEPRSPEPPSRGQESRRRPRSVTGAGGTGLAGRLAAPEPPVLQRALPGRAPRPAFERTGPSGAAGALEPGAGAGAAGPARGPPCPWSGATRLRRGCGEEAVQFPWPKPRRAVRCAGHGPMRGRTEGLEATIMESEGFAGRWGCRRWCVMLQRNGCGEGIRVEGSLPPTLFVGKGEGLGGCCCY